MAVILRLKLYPVFFVDVDASINALFRNTLPSNPISSLQQFLPKQTQQRHIEYTEHHMVLVLVLK